MPVPSLLSGEPPEAVQAAADEHADRSWARDLNLDQIVAAVARNREDHDLITTVLFSPLRGAAAVRYRQDVFRDLEGPGLAGAVRRFAGQLSEVHAHLRQLSEASDRYLAWFALEGRGQTVAIMLTCLVTVSILSTLTVVIALSPVSSVDKDLAERRLEDAATPAQRAELDAARRAFPGYRIDVEPVPGRHRRYIARRTQPGPAPHTLITSDLTELRAELSPTQQSTASPGRDVTIVEPHDRTPSARAAQLRC